MRGKCHKRKLGRGGEMTQILYAHINKKKKRKWGWGEKS
jgi:hypothetical protein